MNFYSLNTCNIVIHISMLCTTFIWSQFKVLFHYTIYKYDGSHWKCIANHRLLMHKLKSPWCHFINKNNSFQQLFNNITTKCQRTHPNTQISKQIFKNMIQWGLVSFHYHMLHKTALGYRHGLSWIVLKFYISNNTNSRVLFQYKDVLPL